MRLFSRAALLAVIYALFTAVAAAAAAEPEDERFRSLRPAGKAAAGRLLTAQEFRVTSLVFEGATNKEVATALFVSEKTVEFHLSNTYRKLGVRSRTELVRVLSEQSLQRPPPQT